MNKTDIQYILRCIKNASELINQSESEKANELLLLAEFFLSEKLTSDNSNYATAVKNLINSEVDCVQTKNGAYVNLDGVIDCINHALHGFA